MSFGFPNTMPVYRQCFYMPCMSLILPSIPIFFLLLLEFSRSFLFIHVGLWPLLLDFLPVWMDCLWTWRMWPLKMNLLSWTPLLSTTYCLRFFQAGPQTSTKSVFLKFGTGILFFPITYLIPDLHIPDQFFLVCKYGVCSSLTTCLLTSSYFLTLSVLRWLFKPLKFMTWSENTIYSVSQLLSI